MHFMTSGMYQVPSLQIYIELYIFVIHLEINNQMAVK